MKIFLPVHAVTGEVDYEYISYLVRELPVPQHLELVDGWAWKPFKIVR